MAAVAELVSSGDSVLALCADASIRRALAGEAADPRRFGGAAALVACCRCDEEQLDAALGATGDDGPAEPGLTLADWGALARRPRAARRFEHVVLVDPPPAEELRAAAALARATPGAAANPFAAGFLHLSWGEAEVELALRVSMDEWQLRPAVVEVFRSLRERGEASGERLARAARRAGQAPAPAGGGRSLRARPGRARSLRMARRSRQSQAAGRILGEDGAGSLGGIPGLPGPARGGQEIPPRTKTETLSKPRGEEDRRGHTRVGEPSPRARTVRADSITKELSTEERALLGDLFAVIEEHSADLAEPIDRKAIERAFAFACESHADQVRKSGEDFITHPLGVARICAGMRLDTATLCAALLHDTVEDTSASHEQVSERFGEEVSALVDGVTKLTGITFQSRDERQAENYRKMMVAMATDVRVILIKLADRLHNMRTLSALPKQKQLEKARETLEIFAPLAHRLGIHAIKWELEDLAFATLHPRKYDEIKKLVAQQRAERERYVNEAGKFLAQELNEVGHRGRDLRPRQALLLDLHQDDPQGAGVQRDLRSDCDAGHGRLGQGLLRGDRDHPLALEAAAGALQGLHRDAEGQQVPGPSHDGDRARGPAAGDPDSHPRACTSWRSTASRRTSSTRRDRRSGDPEKEKMTWLRQLIEAEKDQDPKEFLAALKDDRIEDEVFVFTPKGEVKNLSAGSTPLDFAYSVHTDVGHRCVGAKVNGKIVPLHYELRSGDIVEVLTAKQGRGPSRDWLKLVRTSRARNKIRAWFKREGREDAERRGREQLQSALKKQGLPHSRIAGSALFADVIREMGFRKADDFYIALGQSKVSTKVVVNKLMQRLKQGEAVDDQPVEELIRGGGSDARRTRDASGFGIKVKGVDDVAVRLARCCRPVPGDEIVGYVSLGRGITVHREDCRNVEALKRSPERFTDVSWDGDNEASYRVELQVDAWDRTRLLEDLSRTFAEAGVNILEANCSTKHPMVKNRFVVEVGDTEQLKACVTRLRNIDSVFDAYRLTPDA